MFGLILAPLIQQLAGAGLSKLSEVVTHKGKEFLEEKTGINLDEPESLTPEQVQTLQQFENDNADRWLEDIKSARDMYQNTGHEMSDKIADRVMKVNLPVILALVVTNCLSVYLLRDEGELIAIISNFIGIAIGSLFNERQAVVNFFFGSSHGSKEKSKMFRGIMK